MNCLASLCCNVLGINNYNIITLPYSIKCIVYSVGCTVYNGQCTV